MKTALRFTVLALALNLLTGALHAAPPAAADAAAAPKKLPANKAGKWLEDYDDAIKLAKDTGLPILLDFTGSDWCGWCIKLKKEVFDEKTFKDYAKSSLILMEVDFPRGKKLPAKLVTQNKELAGKHGIKGFPTIVLVDGEGKVLGTTGYQPGGAEKYVEHLKELLQKAAPAAK